MSVRRRLARALSVPTSLAALGLAWALTAISEWLRRREIQRVNRRLIAEWRRAQERKRRAREEANAQWTFRSGGEP